MCWEAINGNLCQTLMDRVGSGVSSAARPAPYCANRGSLLNNFVGEPHGG